MARLNLLRAHRRTNSTQPGTSSQTPDSAATTTAAPLAPSTSLPASVGAAPPRTAALPQLASLPPLDVGSPGLGSPGQWLSTLPSSATSATTTAATTPAPSTGFSRVSTPYTAATSELSPTPVHHVPRPTSKHRNQTLLAAVAAGGSAPGRASSSPATLALASAAAGNTEKHEKHKESRKGTLNRLNPMALLRRRSSQTQIASEKDKRSKLPDDFDPGIIYGTRHPDWSSHPRLTPTDGRSLSPVPVGLGMSPPATSGGDRPQTDQGIATRSKMSPPRISIEEPMDSPPMYAPPPPPTAAPGSPPGRRMSPPTHAPPLPPLVDEAPTSTGDVVAADPIERPSSALSFEVGYVDNEGDMEDEEGDGDKRRGVTLVDNPLALPHHITTNSSKFSFEGSNSNAPSASVSVKHGAVMGDGSSAGEDDSFQFDLDDDDDGEDDGFSKANEGLFDDDGNNLEYNSSYGALEAAVKAMDLGAMHQQQPMIGVAITDDQAIEEEMSSGLGLTGVQTANDFSTMQSRPTERADAEPKHIIMAGRKRLANPRNLDLSDDSDLDMYQDDNGMAGYEDDEDEDFYFDDGIITSFVPIDPPASVPPQVPNVQPPTNEPSPVTPPLDGNFFESQTDLLGASGMKQPANRLSQATTQDMSSGLVPEDGSMETNASQEPQTAFPPFLNPVGGGLGYTQQQHQFYAPNGDGMLNSQALSSLTYTLQQYQLQQAAAAASGGASPYSEYTDVNDMPNFGMPFDPSSPGFDDDYDELAGYDDDDAMVAAANAEALASDSEGFYGSEFGFYSSSLGTELGGFFGSAGGGEMLRPPIRRPSLTPISERSECSYRNSMVFPVAAWNGPISPGMPSALLAEDEMSLGSLMQLRRSAWGGSSTSLGSLGNGGSSPVGIPAYGENAAPGDDYVIGNMNNFGNSPPGMMMNSPPGMQMNSPPQGMQMSPPPQGMQMSPPPQGMQMSSPPGLKMQTPGVAVLGTTPPPPGLSHAGSKAMLPTKGSFEDPNAEGGMSR